MDTIRNGKYSHFSYAELILALPNSPFWLSDNIESLNSPTQVLKSSVLIKIDCTFLFNVKFPPSQWESEGIFSLVFFTCFFSAQQLLWLPKVRAKSRDVSNIERSYLTVDAVINFRLSPQQLTQQRLIPWWALVWSPVGKAFMKVNPSPVHSPLCFTKHWACRQLLLQLSFTPAVELAHSHLQTFLDKRQTCNPRVRVYRTALPRVHHPLPPPSPSLCSP